MKGWLDTLPTKNTSYIGCVDLFCNCYMSGELQNYTSDM